MTEGPSRDEMVLIGRLGRTFGVHGEVRFIAEAEDADWVLRLMSDQFYLLKKNAPPVPAKVVFRRWQGGVLLVQVNDIDSPEQAAALTGSEVAVHESLRPAPPEGEYYLDQLIGLMVIDPQGAEVGDVLRVIEGRGQIFLEVQLRGERAAQKGSDTFLLPPDKNYIEQVSLAERRIYLKMGIEY